MTHNELRGERMFLYEELFLLGIDDLKGRIAGQVEPQLHYGLTGAILSELVLAGRLNLDEKKHLVVVSTETVGDDLQDEALAKIIETHRLRRASFWVLRLSEGMKKVQRRVGSRLVERRILLREEKRYLWVIPYDAYPMVDASAKYWIKQRLRQVVLAREEANAHVAALLGLLRACEMLEFVFTRDELKTARKEIENMTVQDEIGNSVTEAIKAIEAAAIAATMTTIQNG